MAVSSQLARKLHTVLAEMKDAARAERIKALRRDNPQWSQPKLVDAVNELGGPGTIGLRGYQYWEATGGIDYDKAVLLAAVHGVSPEWLYYGPDGKPKTPDLDAMLNGNRGKTEGDVADQLDRIEKRLNEMLSMFSQLGTEDPTPISDADRTAALDALVRWLREQERRGEAGGQTPS